LAKLAEAWSSGEARDELQKWINSLPLLTLQETCTLFRIRYEPADRKVDLATRVLEAFDSLALYHCKTFYAGKPQAVREYIFFCNDPICVELRNQGVSPFPALLRLSTNGIDHLAAIELLSKWISYPTGPQYKLSRSLTHPDIESLSRAIDALNLGLTTASNEIGVVGSTERICTIGSVGLVIIQRQVADRLLREVEGRRRSRPAALGMLRIQEESEVIELRNSGRFLGSILAWIRQTLRCDLSLIDPGLFDAFDRNEFESRMFTRLTTTHDARLAITRLRTRSGLTAGECEIELRSPDRRRDIRGDLKELAQDLSLLRLREPADIESLEIEFDGKPVTVNVLLDKEAFTCRAVPEERKLTDEQRVRLSDLFLESAGFPLLKSIARGSRAINRWWAYDKLFDGPLASDLPSYAHKFREDLTKLGLIAEQDCLSWSCSNGHSGIADNTRPTSCEFCGDEHLTVVPDTRISPLYTRIEQEVLDTILTIPNVEIVARSTTRTIDGKSYQFGLLEVDGQRVYLYFARGAVGRNLLKFFEFSQSALLVVRIGNEGVTSRLIEDSLFVEVSAGRIIEAVVEAGRREAPSDLRRAVERQKETALERRPHAARVSSERLESRLSEPRPGYVGDFETDVFNTLTWWVDSAEMWGRDVIGKALPEGIAGWTAGNPPAGYALAWDAKWTDDTSGYDLNAAERRKAKSYIKKLRQDWELQVFAQDLSVYALVSNHFREAQLASFAQSCKAEFTDWHGQVAFIDADAILGLYRARLSHPDDLLARLELLRRDLTSCLIASGQNFARLRRVDIENLVRQVLEASAPVRQLQVSRMRERISPAA